MFKKSESSPGMNPEPSQPEPAPAPPQQASSQVNRPGPQATIGPSIVIKGELSGAEDLLIQGRVEGSVQLKQRNLTIGKDGHVKADIYAKVITVEGEVDGDLNGEDGIVIRQSGKVRGNIIAPRVNLEDGSKFKGSIDMEPASEAKQPAPAAGTSKGPASADQGKKDSQPSNPQVQALK